MSLVEDILNDDSRRNTIHLVVSAAWTVVSAIFTGIIVHDVTENMIRLMTLLALTGILIISTIWVLVEREISKRQTSRLEELEARAQDAETAVYALEDERERLLVDSHCARMVIREVSALLSSATININSVLHQIDTEGFGWLPKDFFESKCQSACERTYNALVDKYGDDVGFEVTYVMRNEDVDHFSISIVGCKNAHGTSVSRRHKEYRGDDLRRYDCRLFKAGRADCAILMTEDDVNAGFSLEEPNRGKSKQYFAVPVICSSVGGGKMIGLLQVACLNGQMSESAKEVESTASMVLRPCVEALLLIHKAKKAILA